MKYRANYQICKKNSIGRISDGTDSKPFYILGSEKQCIVLVWTVDETQEREARVKKKESGKYDDRASGWSLSWPACLVIIARRRVGDRRLPRPQYELPNPTSVLAQVDTPLCLQSDLILATIQSYLRSSIEREQ